MTYQNAKLNHHDDKHDTKTNNVLSCVKFTHRWNSNTPMGVYLKGADLSNWLRGRGFFGGGGGLFEGEGLIENLQNHQKIDPRFLATELPFVTASDTVRLEVRLDLISTTFRYKPLADARL